MTASLLKDENNTAQGIILTFQDITKIIEMEEQVRRQERLATVGSLAAGIAHEIRNPLASLCGSIQVLQGELDLQGDNKHLMDIVVKETDRLNAIITDFLEYARVKETLAEKIELFSILDETVMLLKNSKEVTNNIRIIRNINRDIMAKGRRSTTQAGLLESSYQLHAKQCLAVVKLPSLQPPSLSPVEETPLCELVIIDTGQGIARDYLDKIFDPFFTTKTGGTGLGLAIVYRIIEDHGGTITVDSEPGKGTRFIIRLPLIEESCYSSDADNALHHKTSL